MHDPILYMYVNDTTQEHSLFFDIYENEDFLSLKIYRYPLIDREKLRNICG